MPVDPEFWDTVFVMIWKDTVKLQSKISMAKNILYYDLD